MTGLRNDLDYPAFLKWGFTSLLVLLIGFSVFAFIGNQLGFVTVEVNDHGSGTGAVVLALVAIGMFFMALAFVGLTVMYWAMKHFQE